MLWLWHVSIIRQLLLLAVCIDLLASHCLKVQSTMSKNDMPDTFLQLILICIRVNLKPILYNHTVVTIELVPLTVLGILVEPRPVKLLD